MMLPHENPVIHKLGKSILKRSVKYSNQIISSNLIHDNVDKQNEGIHEQKLKNITNSINIQQRKTSSKRNRNKSNIQRVSINWVSKQEIQQLKANNQSLKKKISERQENIKQMKMKVEVIQRKYNELVKSQSKRMMLRVNSIHESILMGQKSQIQGDESSKPEGKPNLSIIKKKLLKMNVQTINKKQ